MHEKLKVAAWLTTGTKEHPNRLGNPDICTNPAYRNFHKDWIWQPLVRQSEAQAALDAALERVKVLEADAEMLDFLLATESSFIDRESVAASMAGKGTTE